MTARKPHKGRGGRDNTGKPKGCTHNNPTNGAALGLIPGARVALAQARLSAGIKQGELATLLGINNAHYGKIERGETGLSAERAAILCGRLHLTIHEIVKRTPK